MTLVSGQFHVTSETVTFSLPVLPEVFYGDQTKKNISGRVVLSVANAISSRVHLRAPIRHGSVHSGWPPSLRWPCSSTVAGVVLYHWCQRNSV